VLTLVAELLTELANDPAEFGQVDPPTLLPDLRAAGDRFTAFLALTGPDRPVGVATLSEAVAAYAGGRYGILSELYVRPEHRGTRVGTRLLEAVKAHGRSRGWRRLDVTAPPEARWQRTVRFYERHGFVFTGPKLRCAL
ncbi:MAG TPA: GNAT family N-acetyltransferase, partial [Gemmatimonadales bacterium]|nr:GNAT family N-acetyltransferase [Gemmatimonadales bacterium]